MFRMKKAICALMAVLMLLAMGLSSGCSTPEYAATIDGEKYTTGEYLAFLYNTYYEVMQQNYSNFYYAGYQGKDYWTDVPLTYGEGEDAKEMDLASYIIQKTQDDMVYLKAVDNMLKANNLPYDSEQLKKMEKSLKNLKNDQFLAYGFNNASYKKSIYAQGLAEYSLFYGLYDNNRPRAMTEEQIREGISRIKKVMSQL